MSKQTLRTRVPILVAALAVLALAAAAGAGARQAGAKNMFTVTNLASDQPGVAAHTDPNLVNAWGLAASATSPWWVADNGTDVSTLYDAAGNPFPTASPLVVGVPSAPTGLVASGDNAFPVGTGAAAGPSRFLFSTEAGQILGWHGGLPNALVVVDGTPDGAVFKGLATMNDRLYATDFNNGVVDIFDASYNQLNIPAAFQDPTLPPGYAPFGIQALGGSIYVTFAQQDAVHHDEIDGHGLGYVDKFDVNGQFLARVASQGALNAPWGLAIAPAGFGKFGGDLLVGNFGNGQINAFKPDDSDPNVFASDGKLKDADGSPIAIDGLWALQFGMGSANNGPTSTLFFTAGPADESHGLFGTITGS